MPEFSTEIQDKIIELRALRRLGVSIDTYEMVGVEWPSPDGTIYYSVLPIDQVDDTPIVDIDDVPVTPIDARIIPNSSPDWFLEIKSDASIGDEDVTIEMWDADEAISQLLVDHGEGVKATDYLWFPQVSLLLPVWQGHLRLDEEVTIESIKIKAVQGFRDADGLLPSRAHYQYCSAPFGGLFSTVAEVAACTDCPYNLQASGGTVGIVDPSTGLPWTYCDRRSKQSCIDRGVNPIYHLSHATQVAALQNNQTHGPNLLSTSSGNENNLKDSVRVVMGERRIYGMPVMAFFRATNNNHPDEGFFHAMYEGGEGPIASISGARVSVGGKEMPVVAMHYNYRLGTTGQTAIGNLTTHAYSGTWHIFYVYGPTTPEDHGPDDATATAISSGLNNIRTYTDATTYTTSTSQTRAWHIARMLCDKRWGFGYDYAKLNIDSFIDTAEWGDTPVVFTDTFGTPWAHTRSESRVELIGKKVQQQFEDICMAGRLSRPFLFDGKIHIVPLRALTTDELAACPEFTDEGDEPNIVKENGRTTVTASRKSSLDLVNKVEVTYDDRAFDYLETPLRPVEDVDAQLRAGVVVGDNTRKINSKKYTLLGVTNEAQATKMAWSLLDLGPFDEGGLQNNLTVKLQVWFLDTLDLHQEKVIKVTSAKLTKYGFTYFRIKKMERKADLIVEIECQAYNETYMSTFEGGPPTSCSIDADCPPGYTCVGSVCVPPGPTICSIDSDCPPGYICVNGVCRPYLPPTCKPVIGTMTYTDGTLIIPIEPCDP
jgi:hypothetical protein